MCDQGWFDDMRAFSYTYKGPIAFLVTKGRWGLCKGRSLPSHSNYYAVKLSTLTPTTEGTRDWCLCVCVPASVKASSGMWCEVTADWAWGLGFISGVGIPQLICFPQGITALFRGAGKFWNESALGRWDTPVPNSGSLTVGGDLKELISSLALKPQDC